MKKPWATTDGPVTDGPVTEGPVTEGPVAEGPVAEGSKAEDPTVERPMGGSSAVGRAGEDRAAEFLRRRGYEILERNFRTGRGEVDIIAVRGNTLVFCEVKTWRSIPVEELEHAITPAKSRRIFEASLRFLEKTPRFMTCRLRYDVIHIAGTPSDGVVRHIRNAIERC